MAGGSRSLGCCRDSRSDPVGAREACGPGGAGARGNLASPSVSRKPPGWLPLRSGAFPSTPTPNPIRVCPQCPVTCCWVVREVSSSETCVLRAPPEGHLPLAVSRLPSTLPTPPPSTSLIVPLEGARCWVLVTLLKGMNTLCDPVPALENNPLLIEIRAPVWSPPREVMGKEVLSIHLGPL